jgi:hypothetical protein
MTEKGWEREHREKRRNAQTKCICTYNRCGTFGYLSI